MNTISPSLRFFLQLAKVQSVMGRRFDAGLGGLGFSDFLILFHLSHAKDGKMRRVDLAEKIGLTASGVTRLLAPMEKIGLVKREVNAFDARVSYVVLANGGKTKLADAMTDAELLSLSALKDVAAKKTETATEVLDALVGSSL